MLEKNELQFCFRIIEPADKPGDEPSEIYWSMKFENVYKPKLSEHEYTLFHQRLPQHINQMYGSPLESIHLISLSEYIAATEGDEEIELKCLKSSPLNCQTYQVIK